MKLHIDREAILTLLTAMCGKTNMNLKKIHYKEEDIDGNYRLFLRRVFKEI